MDSALRAALDRSRRDYGLLTHRMAQAAQTHSAEMARLQAEHEANRDLLRVRWAVAIQWCGGAEMLIQLPAHCHYADDTIRMPLC